tara:strand:- start:3070 stop:3318 length:249 start_codon:yes stop_codon:yes gene_type:complete
MHIDESLYRDSVPAPVWAMLDRFVEGQQIEFAGNYRAYRIRDGLHKAVHDQIKDRSCCDVRTWTVTIPQLGEEWCLGCDGNH